MGDVQAVLDFVRKGPPHVATFVTTLGAKCRPSMRQVGTFVEDDFTITTVTRLSSVRVRHLRMNPTIAYLWVDKEDQHPARNVQLRGTAEVVTDTEALQAFLDRRQSLTGIAPPPEILLDRCLTITRPDFLRAEGFLEAGALLVLRDFLTLQPETVAFGI